MLRQFWQMLQRAFSRWNAHDAPRMGAALAFYTVLSLAPLLVLVVGIAGLVFGKAEVEQQIVTQITGLIGSQAADAIRVILRHAQKPASGIMAGILGILTLLFGASGVFTELRSALNKVWEFRADPAQSGIMGMVRDRLFSFGMVLAVGFMLLVSLVISAMLAALGHSFAGFLPAPQAWLHALNFAVSFAVITFIFVLIFRYVPAVRLPWQRLWPGGAFTSVLFVAGKFLIGLYLGEASVASPYGAAGSIVIVIIWLYYSAQIFYFGAEFTEVYARSSGWRRSGDVAGAQPTGSAAKEPIRQEEAVRPSRFRQLVLGLAALRAVRQLARRSR